MEDKLWDIKEFEGIPCEDVVWEEVVGEEKFALVIFRLCNDKGLTFKEALALATPGEFTENLMKRWNCTRSNVANLRLKGYKKYAFRPDVKEGWDYMPTPLTYVQAPFIHLFKGAE